MIKVLSLLLITTISFNATFSQKAISGSGNVTSETRAVSTFNRIDANGVFNVVLKQGSTESVVVETDDNLQSLVVVEVSNGTLKLSNKKNSNFKKTKKMLVTVTFKNIDYIDNHLVGNLSSEGSISLASLEYVSKAVGNTTLTMDVTNLDMNLKAVGNTTFTGKSTTCVFNNKSVGNFDGDDFAVTNMDLNNKAIGNTNVNAENLKLDNKGIGNVRNKKKKVKSTNDDNEV